MGRNLFIRVSAQTYDERAVLKDWPKLFAAVWPEPGVDGADSPASIARKLVPAPGRGVLELADAFAEYLRFAEMPEERRKRLQPFADKVENARRALDEALGDRDVHKAHELTNTIEDALDEAEKAMRA